MRGVPSGSFDRVELDDRQRLRMFVADYADVHLAPFDVLLDQHGRIEIGVQPVDPLHQFADRRDDGVELDPDRSVLPRRFDDDRELEVVGKIEAAAIRTGENGRVNAVELQDLLGHRLVLAVQQARASRCR